MNPLRKLDTLLRGLVDDYNASLDPPQDPDGSIARRIVTLVAQIDKALTNKEDNRSADRDLPHAQDVLGGGSWEVYLSDGGYSRMQVSIAEALEGDPCVCIDRMLSREPVIAAFEHMMRED